MELSKCVTELVNECHGAAAKAGWWDRPKTWETVPRCLMLIVSEVAEAMEGDRKDLMDDKLPHRKMLEVELADAMIRIADLAGALDLDLGGAITEKLVFNAEREDHKLENRGDDMNEIKMYVFIPPGHGPLTFMVAERSLEAARRAVELKIASDPMTHGLSSEGFMEGYYTVHEFNVGEVEWNPND